MQSEHGVASAQGDAFATSLRELLLYPSTTFAAGPTGSGPATGGFGRQTTADLARLSGAVLGSCLTQRTATTMPLLSLADATGRWQLRCVNERISAPGRVGRTADQLPRCTGPAAARRN